MARGLRVSDARVRSGPDGVGARASGGIRAPEALVGVPIGFRVRASPARAVGGAAWADADLVAGDLDGVGAQARALAAHALAGAYVVE